MAATEVITGRGRQPRGPVYRQPLTVGVVVRKVLFWGALTVSFFFFIFPLAWLFITSLKARAEVSLLPPAYIPFLQFEPTLINYLAVFTRVAEYGRVTVGEQSLALSAFPQHLLNSIIVSGATTILSVGLGTMAAYSFSRFKVSGAGDLLFFILSTRMLPPVVVLIPIFLMFTWLNLRESYLGIILLYTTVGLPFVVWMMKGFFDDIPKEYEEAAMMDGYSRLEAFFKIVIPEAFPAMLATAVFVLITAWNEFVFVQLLNPSRATTVPPFLYSIIGYGQVQWGRMAATSVVYLLPVVIFTFLVRRHLLRGVTFGAVRR